jgi:hypothetical protein
MHGSPFDKNFLSSRSALDSLIERRLQVKFRATLLASRTIPADLPKPPSSQYSTLLAEPAELHESGE